MKILAVTSGKGGVGKTTLSLNIARQLSLSSFRVLLVDFDIHNKGSSALFLGRVNDSSPSVISVVHSSDTFDPARVPELANSVRPIPLTGDGLIIFLPAARPREMVLWRHFVAPNERIVAFWRSLLTRIAESYRVDIVLIDCYGGIDSLTVAAAGIADDTIIVNEPDVITFSGTLLLYNYIAEIYRETDQKPRVHFVINRITSRHSFSFLDAEYKKHLSQLAIQRSVLAYIPYDKLLLETFGDYPFFTELLPKSLITRKIRLLVTDLWKGTVFDRVDKSSFRKRQKTYEQLLEAPLADPERLLRLGASTPFWLMVPLTIVLALKLGLGGAINFRILIFSITTAMVMVGIVIGLLAIFVPVQISRWLLRVARYRRRKRLLTTPNQRFNALGKTLYQYAQGIFPGFYAVCIFLPLVVFYLIGIAGIVMDDSSLASIWPKVMYGFKPHGDYHGLSLDKRASIRPGTDLQHAVLSDARLAGIGMSGIDLQYARLDRAVLSDANMRGDDLRHAYLAEANLSSAVLWRANLVGVDFRKTKFVTSLTGLSLLSVPVRHSIDFTQADLSSANLEDVNLPQCWLRGATLSGTHLEVADLSQCDLSFAVLDNALAMKADLHGASLACARLTNANLAAATLDSASLAHADLRSANLKNVSFANAVFYEADLRNNKTASTVLLSYAQAAGALLDERQNSDVAKWNRQNPGTDWLVWGGAGPSKRAYDNFCHEDPARSASDTVECDVLAANRQAWTKAETILNAHTISDGLLQLLTLELAIAQGRKEDVAAQQWSAWLSMHERLEPWLWNAWNMAYPGNVFTAEQTRKFTILQKSAMGLLTAKQFDHDFFHQKE